MDAEYKIIGGDGSEYGPATLAELKEWIGAGRVAHMTQVWRNDSTAWLPAAQYSELQPDLSKQNAAVALARVQGLDSTGFWARLGAFVLDQFLISFVVAIIWSFLPESQHLKFTLPAQINFNSETEMRALIQQLTLQMQAIGFHMAFIYYPIFLIYDVWFNGRFGATLGKMAIRARIIQVNGMPIGYQTAFLRWLASRLSQVIFCLGFLMMIFQPQKRALQDFLAGTRVVFIR